MSSLALFSTTEVLPRKVWPVGQPADDYDELKRQFGPRLRALLDERTMSQAALGRAVAKPPSEINRYVRGEVLPKYRTQVAIARALDVTVGYLVYGEAR